ncbi:helix-turn-helix domain-containing protein [Xenophilus aerolatus]
MSTRIMSLCWPMAMRPPAKAVLISLADMANDEGYCWPSIDRLCERTCYGRTAVIEAIAWLETRGVVRANRTNGRKTTYWVMPDKYQPEAAGPEPDVPTSPLVAQAPNQSATRTGTPPGPVRHANGTSPPRGRVPVRPADTNRHLTVKEPSSPPTPPADAGGGLAPIVKPVDAGADAGVGFEAVWAVYLRHTAEARARRQWARLNPDAALRARILAAVVAQAAGSEWQRLVREDKRHLIPMLSTWLHGRRWEDAVDGKPDCALAPAVVWDERRSTVEAWAAKLGMPRWTECEAWQLYRDRVRGAWRSARAAEEAGSADAH